MWWVLYCYVSEDVYDGVNESGCLCVCTQRSGWSKVVELRSERKGERESIWLCVCVYLGEANYSDGDVGAELGTDLNILVFIVCRQEGFVEETHVCVMYMWVSEEGLVCAMDGMCSERGSMRVRVKWRCSSGGSGISEMRRRGRV